MSSSSRSTSWLPRWPAPIEALAERVNPVLVKEVRQALRGRYFRLMFWLTLSGATIVGLGVLVTLGDELEELGSAFSYAIFACLAVGAHGFVPFSAFVAMGNEWEENTYDLLVLSNLRPRQIVVGKLLSAGVQALLLYSAFGPFLVFAFLLGGVDLVGILVVLALSMMLSLGLSATAISLSTSVRTKFMRVFAMAALAGFLVWVTATSMVFGSWVLEDAGELRDSEVQIALAAFASIFLAFVPLPLEMACSRLSHPEENRSSVLRAYAYLLLALMLGWATYALHVEPDLVPALGFSLTALTFLAVGALYFLSEPLCLGRRARLGVPRSPLLALLTLPLQPGSARALVWFLLGALGIWLWFVAVQLALPGFTGGLPPAGVLSTPLVMALFALVYLGLPALLTQDRGDHPGMRILILVLPIGIAALSILGPALYGFFAHDARLIELAHRANPVYMFHLLWKDRMDEAVPGLVGLSVMAVVVLGLNGHRIVDAVRETLAASAARRAQIPSQGSEVASAPPALSQEA